MEELGLRVGREPAEVEDGVRAQRVLAEEALVGDEDLGEGIVSRAPERAAPSLVHPFDRAVLALEPGLELEPGRRAVVGPGP